MTQPLTDAQRKHELGLLARALRQYLVWQRELGADGAPHPSAEELAHHVARVRAAERRAFEQEMGGDDATPAPAHQSASPSRRPPTQAEASPAPAADPKAALRRAALALADEPATSKQSANKSNIYRFNSLMQSGASVTRRPSRPPQAEGVPQRLAEVQNALDGCQKCALCRGRRNIVFGAGGPAPRLMFIGAAPGVNEDRQGRPFVGKAGQLLSRMVKAMNLDRKEVYVCHAVKCRPPGNRAPRPEELETCSPVLAQQLEIVRPEVVVTLGEVAAQSVLKARQPLSRLQGEWQLWTHASGLKIRVMPTLHPEHLLRHPEDKGLVWQHLQKVMAVMNLKA